MSLKLFKIKKKKFSYGGSTTGVTSGGGTYNDTSYTPVTPTSKAIINSPMLKDVKFQYVDPITGMPESAGGLPQTTAGGKGTSPADTPGMKIDMDKLSKLAGKGHTAAVNSIIGQAETLSKDLQNVSALDLSSNPVIYEKVNRLQDLVGPNSQNMLLRQVKETDSQWAEGVKKQNSDSYVSKDGQYLVKDVKSGRYLFVPHEGWLVDRASGNNKFSQPLTVNELKSAYDLEMSGRFGTPEASFNKYLGYNVGKEYIQNQLEKVMDNISASAQKSDNKFFQAFGHNQFNESMVQSVRQASGMETNRAQVEAAVNAIAKFLDPASWETIMAEAAMKVNPKTLSSGDRPAIRSEKMQAAYQVLIDYFAPKNFTKTESTSHRSFDAGATTWSNAPRGKGRGGSGGDSSSSGKMDFFHRAQNFDNSLLHEGVDVVNRDPNDYSKILYMSKRIALNPEQQKQLEGFAGKEVYRDGVKKTEGLSLAELLGTKPGVMVGDRAITSNDALGKIKVLHTTPHSIQWKVDPSNLSAFNQAEAYAEQFRNAAARENNPNVKQEYANKAIHAQRSADQYKKWYGVVTVAGEEDLLKASGIIDYSRRDLDGKIIKTDVLSESDKNMMHGFGMRPVKKTDVKDLGDITGDYMSLNNYYTMDVLVPIQNMNMSDPANPRTTYFAQDAMQSEEQQKRNTLYNMSLTQ